MISPYKLTWQGMSSLDLNLWTGIAFDGDDGDVETHLSREAVVSEAYNGVLKRAHGYKWSESFTFSVTFVKQDYSDFSEQENRRILRWLTSSPNASFVNIYKKDNEDDSETISWCALGNWINVSQYKQGNGRIVGYVAEWESLTPYALSDLREIIIPTNEQAPNSVTTIIEIESDEPQLPIFPRITVEHKGIVVSIDGALTIHSDMIENTVYHNSTTGIYYWRTFEPHKYSSIEQPNYDWSVVEVDHAYTDSDQWEENTIYHYSTDGDNMYYWIDPYTFHEESFDPNLTTTSVKITNDHNYYLENEISLPVTRVKNNTSDEKIILDGANRVISSSYTNRIFGDDFINWTWLPLLDGTNNITVQGNCTVKFEWREPLKVGEF